MLHTTKNVDRFVNVYYQRCPVPPVDRRVSIYDIAEETGYSPSGIHRALDRLGIEPEDVTPGGVRYFSPLAIEKLREHMRTKPKNGDQ